MKLSTLDMLARRQHGVVAHRQTDLSEAAWRRAINAGSLLSTHTGVARLVGTADTPEQRIMIAVLAAGPGAVASHRSAAHLHGVPGLAETTAEVVDVIVPARPTGAQARRAMNVVGIDGAQVHRPRDISGLAPHRIAGIPCTNLLRTLVDLGAVAPEMVNGAVGHALANDLASLSAIESARDRHAGRGRRGIVALRQAIDDWAIDDKPADSVLEPAMRRLVDRYGLPPVEFHPIVGGREVDFRVVGAPIVIECDGWTYHGRDRKQFERDRRMDAEFSAHGWVVLRFTYRRITTRPAEVAGVIARTIERWATQLPPDAA